MKTIIALTAAICLVSCVPVAYPVGTPNPLDEPGYRQPTVQELHLQNLRAITCDPARQ